MLDSDQHMAHSADGGKGQPIALKLFLALCLLCTIISMKVRFASCSLALESKSGDVDLATMGIVK